jgi:hypothetical protein
MDAGIAVVRFSGVMIRRRDSYNPLARSLKPSWLAVWDMQFNLLDSTELAPQADLAAVMRQTADQWSAQGWTIESGARYGSFFCRRGAERRLIAISAADPAHSTGGGPSWHEPCPTCGE